MPAAAELPCHSVPEQPFLAPVICTAGGILGNQCLTCAQAEMCAVGTVQGRSSVRERVLHVQLEGPDVAPLTVGKQNLILYVLRQLEKHFYEVNQFFRVYSCSHDEALQQASISLAVVSHNEITVGLDVVRSACKLSSAVKACYNDCSSSPFLLFCTMQPFAPHYLPPSTPPLPIPDSFTAAAACTSL